MKSFSFKGAYRIRWQVFARDKFTCQYCGMKAPDTTLEVDHKNPISDGGSWEMDNLITACSACNRGKGALTQFLVLREFQRKHREERNKVPTVANRLTKELASGNKGIKELSRCVGNSEQTVSRILRRMLKKGEVVKLDIHTWALAQTNKTRA